MSIILFVFAFIGYVIGLILHESGVLFVGKHVLIDGFNVFDNGLDSGPLWPLATRSPHPTRQPALAYDDIDNGLSEFDVIWDVNNIFESYFNGILAMYLMTHHLVCVFSFL